MNRAGDRAVRLRILGRRAGDAQTVLADDRFAPAGVGGVHRPRRQQVARVGDHRGHVRRYGAAEIVVDPIVAGLGEVVPVAAALRPLRLVAEEAHADRRARAGVIAVKLDLLGTNADRLQRRLNPCRRAIHRLLAAGRGANGDHDRASVAPAVDQLRQAPASARRRGRRDAGQAGSRRAPAITVIGELLGRRNRPRDPSSPGSAASLCDAQAQANAAMQRTISLRIMALTLFDDIADRPLIGLPDGRVGGGPCRPCSSGRAACLGVVGELKPSAGVCRLAGLVGLTR